MLAASDAAQHSESAIFFASAGAT
ncbi:protein of unknown function [Hyphomicrobium sp. MC1]|nr:protein of unknown function [Hyphomicrobium sp. MC1]